MKLAKLERRESRSGPTHMGDIYRTSKSDFDVLYLQSNVFCVNTSICILNHICILKQYLLCFQHNTSFDDHWILGRDRYYRAPK